jgi:hypothetical protein
LISAGISILESWVAVSDSELEVRNLAALILNISTNRRIA